MKFIDPYNGKTRYLIIQRFGDYTTAGIYSLGDWYKRQGPFETYFTYSGLKTLKVATVARYHKDPENPAIGRVEAIRKLLRTFKDGSTVSEKQWSPKAAEYARRVWAAYYSEYEPTIYERQAFPILPSIASARPTLFGRLRLWAAFKLSTLRG